MDLYDKFHSEYEERLVVIGRVGEVLYVVYTERDEKFRLISARIAEPEDERWYYERMGGI